MFQQDEPNLSIDQGIFNQVPFMLPLEGEEVLDFTAVEMFPKKSEIDIAHHRFPHSIVWCPLPLISWLFPLIGHVGIADSNGVITDFAAPYYVSEDDMAFGWPTTYFQIDLDTVGGPERWDEGVYEAKTEYKGRMHNLCCDNCHSHVAYALSTMQYKGSDNWNMYNVGWLILLKGKYTGFAAFLRTWLPFALLVALIGTIIFFT